MESGAAVRELCLWNSLRSNSPRHNVPHSGSRNDALREDPETMGTWLACDGKCKCSGGAIHLIGWGT